MKHAAGEGCPAPRSRKLGVSRQRRAWATIAARVDAERGVVGVPSANIRMFFLTIFVLALVVLAFLLAAPVFAGSS